MNLFDFIETDPWPVLKPKIMAERQRRIEGLLHVSTLEGMRQEQGWVAALDWVLEEATPKPYRRDDSDDQE